MANEKQITANRRNAAKSTGPRSAAGRKRAGRNAYRHGLSVNVLLNEALTNQLEERACEIAGRSQNPLTLAWARSVAAAELDVDRVRWTKVLLIGSVSAFEGVDPAQISDVSSIRPFQPNEQSMHNPTCRLVLSAAQGAIFAREPERSTEAIRRSLRQLWRLDRYERRAEARRDRAARALMQCLKNEGLDK